MKLLLPAAVIVLAALGVGIILGGNGLLGALCLAAAVALGSSKQMDRAVDYFAPMFLLGALAVFFLGLTYRALAG